MSNTLEREHEEIEYDPGSTVTIDLPRSHFYERLNLLCNYDVEVESDDDERDKAGILDLIEDVSVQFDGSQTIKSTSFAMSHYIDWYQYQTRPVFEEPDWTSSGEYDGSMQTFIDFMVAPGNYGAMLPSFQFSDLTLSVKWATGDDVADDVSVNDATVKVQSDERKRRSVPTKRRPMSQILDNLYGFKETERRRTIDTTGETTIKLPRGNSYYAIPIAVYDGDEGSNDLVERVVVEENGVSTHTSASFDTLRAKDKEQYGIEDRTEGFAYLNYGLHGDLSDIVPTRNMDDFELKLDVGDTQPSDDAEVRVVTQEIVT